MAASLVWLNEPAARDRTLVGGKVAALARLVNRYPVPSGFCLTTEAYIRAGPLNVMPPDVVELLARAYDELSGWTRRPDTAVAVRSSGIHEDGEHSSFAGQYETLLNRKGFPAVVDAVRSCWNAAACTRTLAYRQHQGLGQSGNLAVLVQQFIVADTAGVAFSAHPVTGNQLSVVINASWGLGESVVSGRVTPDMYIVNKADPQSQQAVVADKEYMVVAVDEGTVEARVPTFLRKQPSLTPQQVSQIGGLATSLEQQVGHPVDVEFAFCEGRLHLLQCRPITNHGRIKAGGALEL